jgi:hypothetical protein
VMVDDVLDSSILQITLILLSNPVVQLTCAQVLTILARVVDQLIRVTTLCGALVEQIPARIRTYATRSGSRRMLESVVNVLGPITRTTRTTRRSPRRLRLVIIERPRSA